MQARATWRQERSFAPGPSPALARRKTPHFRGTPAPKVPAPFILKEKRTLFSRPTEASCHHVQHSCRSPSRQRSCVSKKLPHHLRRPFSKVEFNLAAIPPHLCREESRQKCSGQPGGSRPGCWRRECQSPRLCVKTVVLAPKSCCQPHTAPVLPHQHRSVEPQFESLCLFANGVVPRITVFLRSLLWAVPAQAGEAVCQPHNAGLCRGQGA